MDPRPRAACHLPFLLLVACQGEPPPITVTDGATATGSIAISAKPVLTIAPTDSDGVPVLAYTVDATRLSSGAVAVVDRVVQAVMLFDSGGRLVTRTGREGAGPGEFSHITGVGQCAADTLFVWDPGNGRMSVLDSSGKFIRAYQLSAEPVARYCAGATDFIVWARFLGSAGPSPDAPPVRGIAVLRSASGDSVGALGELQAGENRPLGVVTSFAVTQSGVYVGLADSALVALHRSGGGVVRSFPVGGERREATTVEYDAAITSLSNTIPGTAEERAGLRDFLVKRFPMPKYLPAYRTILTNSEGALFVVTSPLGEGHTEIELFDALGNSVGHLRIPGDLDVYEVGTDYLLGMAEDDQGEQRVVVYSIELPPQ